MDSRHLVDPELAPFLDMFPSTMLSRDTLGAVRNRVLPLPPVEECNVDLERIMVPGPAGAPEIMLHVYRPRAAARPLPCIYHIHGGGYVAARRANSSRSTARSRRSSAARSSRSTTDSPPRRRFPARSRTAMPASPGPSRRPMRWASTAPGSA